MTAITVRMSDELAGKLKVRAGKRGLTAVVVGLIEAWLANASIEGDASIQDASIQSVASIPNASKAEMPKVRGMMRASELPARLGRCSYHGCGKPGVRAFGDGWRCGEH